MESVVLVIHLILALSIIVLVLLQRSEGGGLGIGGGGGGLGGFASARGTANALTKMTGLCAAGFFITSLTLGVLATDKRHETTGLLENMDPPAIEAPVSGDDTNAAQGISYTPPDAISDQQSPVEAIKNAVENTVQGNKPEAPTVDTKTQEEPSAPVE